MSWITQEKKMGELRSSKITCVHTMLQSYHVEICTHIWVNWKVWWTLIWKDP